ncbi:hypothetical protein OG738_21755 [Amycolatopsis sp. NBC_01488]|uniref:hypothetical protein n=1 Tax=Amycolatopsis sp. NBC_01488 TaxID=2903563 RepID=UPI002E29FFC3|nr:hypothetical protein [Amycolatopsis sp. NBC_01488]
MGPFVSDFRTSLSEQGYSVLAVGNMLTDMGASGRWMQEHDVQPDQLSPAVIADFRSDCVAAGRRKVSSVKCFAALLRFLRGEGVIGDPPAPESALERLLVGYRGWLVTERSLAEMTIIRYENLARRFLQQHLTEAASSSKRWTGRRWCRSCCASANVSASARPRAGWPSCGRC